MGRQRVLKSREPTESFRNREPIKRVEKRSDKELRKGGLVGIEKQTRFLLLETCESSSRLDDAGKDREETTGTSFINIKD